MDELKDILKRIPKHLTTGISYMVPVVVGSGLLFALAVVFAGLGKTPTEGFWGELASIGKVGLGLYVPIFSAFTAFSIADRPGIAPGLIGGMVAMNVGAGFLGAIFAGLAAGIIAFYLKKIKLPSTLKPMLPLVIIPIVSTFIVGGLFYWIIGAPLRALTTGLGNLLLSLQEGGRVIMGAVIGAFAGFDYGGPVNKTAVVFVNGLFADGITGPRAWFNAGNPAAPIAMVFATWLAPKKFTKTERTLAPSTSLMGLFGICEGVIPFAINDPLRVIASTVVGCATGSALAAFFNLETLITWSGLITLPGISNPGQYLLSLGLGVAVTVAMLVLLKKPVPEDIEETSVEDFIGG